MLRSDPNSPFPHLSKAPITEAVIELRGSTLVAWDADRLEALVKQKFPEFSSVARRKKTIAQVSFGGGSPTPSTVKDMGCCGFQLKSGGQEVIKCERETFVFSHLTPYPGWDTFEEKAFVFWERYKAIFRPLEIIHVGLRFINRIPLPLEGSLAEVFSHPPRHPDDMEAVKFTGFLHQEVIFDQNTGHSVNLIKTIQPEPALSQGSLIIDIDAHCTKTTLPEKDRLRAVLAQLRSLKNRVFFGSLTESCVDSFK